MAKERDKEKEKDKLPWFKRREPKKPFEAKTKTVIPEGLWVKCPACLQFLYNKELKNNLNVCPKCDYHFRLSSEERFLLIFDDGEYKEFAREVVSMDPLGFVDHKSYVDRLADYQSKVGRTDAVRNAIGKVGGQTCVVCAMEYEFMGGSMGSAVGEKITRGVERALQLKTPLIIISASGGARMQEGALSLMQMGKVSAALAKLDEARLPYISIMADPTTGGVTASYAMLGDLNVAEPRALIGFTGPRVIKQTIRQDLPEGFQRSEFLLDRGMLDLIIPRKEMKRRLVQILRVFYNPELVEAEAG
jgi:acetyl-CoA carboxylase carboxyl transferase subunit beta